MSDRHAEVTVIVVSFNTRSLTLKALATLIENAGDVAMKVVVWDNASGDGSAEAIAGQFPQVEVIRSEENLGFGAANNAVAARADSEFLLLLNSDTETMPGAVEALLRCARRNPRAGIVGGQTLFADGTLNPTSCMNRMGVWSLFCAAIGLTRAFPASTLFNPEGMGDWQRDSAREVDLVSGALMMVPRDVWEELGGFDARYFMYGEDHDLCLRAARRGYRPMITPEAQIVHHGGASAALREDKLRQLMKGKASLIRDHWRGWRKTVGLALLRLSVGLRRVASMLGRDAEARRIWRSVWLARTDWLRGY